MIVHLRPRLFSILLDRKPHPTDELVQRIGHTIDPSMAVRTTAKYINGQRARGYQRNKSGKIILSRRKPTVDPGQLSIDTAIRKVVVRALQGSKRDKIIEGGHDGWSITQTGVEKCKNRFTAGKITNEMKKNLMNLGKFF